MIRFTTTLMWALLVTALAGPVPSKATELQPVGSGTVRYLGMIKVYDATLYAPAQATEEAILSASQSFCLQLDYAVAVPADAFVEAAETVLARQYQPQSLSDVRGSIDLLHRSYRDVEAGDRYRLCYDHNRQASQLLLNDETLITIESAEFAAVYFGIWLNPNQPLDRSLRNNLMAGLQEDRS